MFRNKVVMKNYEEFEKWVSDNNLLYNNFQIYKETVEHYISWRVENAEDALKVDICKNFYTVLQKCDEITYDEPGVPEAYIILHFLDRYHRFQIIYMDMLRRGIFPIKEKICLMDVGTGPGPSMFAFSDMVMMLQEFEREKWGETTIKEVVIDYAEQSDGFRNFLHFFTEFLLLKGHGVFVPFHHGTYYDAKELSFSSDNGRSGGYWINKKKKRKAFDMVIYSNFLTTINTLDLFAQQVKQAVFQMRNNGVLLVIGGAPNNNKYFPVYEKLNYILQKQKYCNRKYIGSCKRVLNAEKMIYRGDSIFSKEIKSVYQEMIDMLTENEWSKLDANFATFIKNHIESQKDEKWFVTAFKRRSIYRELINNKSLDERDYEL